MDVHIYGLIDPREKNICYVGQTKFLVKRYYVHCEQPDAGGNKLKAAWIRELRQEKRKPLLYIFETTCERLAYEREAFWMMKAEELGFSLLNKQVYRMLGVGWHPEKYKTRKRKRRTREEMIPINQARTEKMRLKYPHLFKNLEQPRHITPASASKIEKPVLSKQRPESLFERIKRIAMKSLWTRAVEETPCEQDLISRYDEKQEKLAHKASLAQKYNLVNHSKLDMIYTKAWELGHAQGLTEVEFYFGEFSEVLQ